MPRGLLRALSCHSASEHTGWPRTSAPVLESQGPAPHCSICLCDATGNSDHEGWDSTGNTSARPSEHKAAVTERWAGLRHCSLLELGTKWGPRATEGPACEQQKIEVVR